MYNSLHKALIRLRTAAAIMAAALLVPSCSPSLEDNGGSAPVHGEYTFGIYITLGDNVSNENTSRAPSADGYDPGAGYENYIDLATPDYRIYLFNARNELLYAVPPVDVELLPTDRRQAGSKTYELRFTLRDMDAHRLNPDACVFKLLMLANWRDYPENIEEGVTTVEEMMKSQAVLRDFTAPTGAELTEDDRIPLFGINLFGPLKLQPESFVLLDKLHLLRAYSKIEVFDSETSTDSLQAVELTRYNRRGYNAPLLNDWLQGEYVCDSYAADYGSTFRPAIGAEVDEALPLRRRKSDGHWYIYVPEYCNTMDGGVAPRPARSRLKATYKDSASGILHIYYIDFKYYDTVNAALNGGREGDFFDLRRNHWYRYELNRTHLDMMMRVDVVPYTSVELNPSFGFDDPLPRPPSEWITPPWVEIHPDRP